MGQTKKSNNKRRYSGGGPRPDKREKRRAEALARADVYAGMTIEQKLRALPPEPEAKRHRAKLLTQLEEQRNPKSKQSKKEEETNATSAA